jgi:hypothetical protein
LERIIDGWYRDGTLTLTDLPTGGEGADVRTKRRRRPHLMALALVELARRQVESGDLGLAHDVRPHLNLTVDAADLAKGLPGQLRVPGHNDPVMLPAESMRRILCDADLTDVVTTTRTVRATGEIADIDPGAAVSGATVSGSGAPMPATLQAAFDADEALTSDDLIAWLQRSSRAVLYVGRSKRTVNRRQRVALDVRDGGCAFPDCRVNPSRCDAHHVHHWERGGPTDLDNLVLLCTAHHHLVHEGGWAITADPDLHPGTRGYWTFAPPPRRTRP